MNKKIKFVLIIFIIIVVMLLGIIFFRYNILKDILTRYNKSISDINYYYSYENEDYTNSVWRKGDLILQESYLKSDNSKVITWRDRTTNEGYKLFEKSKVYSTDASGINEAPVNSIILENNKLIELALNFNCKITSKKYDNTMCWHIKLNNSEAYIDKETGFAVRDIEKSNKEITRQTDMVIDYDYKFNIVTDSDIIRPDITVNTINE